MLQLRLFLHVWKGKTSGEYLQKAYMYTLRSQVNEPANQFIKKFGRFMQIWNSEKVELSSITTDSDLEERRE